MKIALQLATSVLALGGLLFQATSHATNLAEQPLKASVLAKPNVIFAMDNSGSMDAEVLLSTYQGWYWSKTGSAGPFNGSALHNTADRAYAYLFPNGVPTPNTAADDGRKIPTQANGSNAGNGIPPTYQFAFARSSEYNSIYYDTTKTYKPWGPGYVSSALTFVDATPSAVKSHPVLVTTATPTTMNLTADITSTDDEWRFAFTYGMRIPTGTTNLSCGSAGSTYTGTSICYGSVTYYPATFWRKEDCGTTSTADNASCVLNYDGQKLKRYEIKSGVTFPSGRTYAAEMQNFANWFQYYRKRKLLQAGAMGAVLEDLTGMRLGVVAFTPNATPTMYDTDSSNAALNARKVAGIFYDARMGGSTPTRATYKYVYDQFDTNTNIVQYACQRNAAFIITDGFANDAAVPTIPTDYTATAYGSGVAPYTTTPSGWLADQGRAYFIRRLRATTGTLPAGKVPLGNQAVTNPDSNPDLHVNTYAMTLGMRGEIWPANSTPFTSAPSWPTPVVDTAKMIDDLWHATINGRGQMYLATDVESATIGIQAAMSDIKSQVGAQSSVAVSTANLLASDGKAYEASYNPAGWTGDLTAKTVNATTGTIAATATWTASTLLNARNWATRVVFASNGSSTGVPFTTANVGATVNPDTATFTNAGVVDYLRGNRTGEGTTYRTRTSLIGAVINAKPAVDGATGVAYLASSEGMLHAFNTTTGQEEWAFVPYGSLTQIGQTVERAYAFKTKLDATPVIGLYAANAKMVTGGLGAAGRSYYAVDVTAPKSLSESAAASKVKWTFPSPSQTAYQAKMGYTVGRPVLVKTADNGYVTLVTSGYDNGYTIGDGKGRVWMLNSDTGAVITEFTTTAGAVGAEAGLSQLAAYQDDYGIVRYAYGGDLLGNLWKFDLKDGTTTLLAVLKDGSGNTQPVTTAPQLSIIGGKPLIMVGTGRLLDITDFGGSTVQSIYAITDDTYLPNARSALATLTRSGSNITGTVDWATKRGWYVDLPAGEVVNVDPKYALGWLHVVTNIAGGSDCSASSYAYRINIKSGTGEASTISSTTNAAEPVIVQGSDLFRWVRKDDSTNDSTKLPALDPVTSRKNAWREITR